jgi:hypothetical protein
MAGKQAKILTRQQILAALFARDVAGIHSATE